jgi:hypothetical protein
MVVGVKKRDNTDASEIFRIVIKKRAFVLLL